MFDRNRFSQRRRLRSLTALPYAAPAACVALAPRTDEARQRKRLELTGVHAVLINLTRPADASSRVGSVGGPVQRSAALLRAPEV